MWNIYIWDYRVEQVVVLDGCYQMDKRDIVRDVYDDVLHGFKLSLILQRPRNKLYIKLILNVLVGTDVCIHVIFLWEEVRMTSLSSDLFLTFIQKA